MLGRFLGFALVVAATGLCACAGFSGKASPWMMEKLKKHAAFDMQCTEEGLTTQETATWTYGVRGCGKQAIYLMQACNQMTKQCTFVRNSDISAIETPAATPPADAPAGGEDGAAAPPAEEGSDAEAADAGS